MKTLSLFKNLALTAAILGSTQVYSTTQMTPQQIQDIQRGRQQAEMVKRHASAAQQDAAAQQQQYAQQQAIARQQQQFQRSLTTQLSQAGKFLNVTNPTQLQDAIKSAKGNENLINAILQNYESKNYPPVTNLSLDGFGLTRIPEGLRNAFYVRSLQTLSLVQNRLESLAGIGVFKNLTTLTVGLNKIADISEIQFLPRLTFFSAVRCNLTDASMKFTLPASLRTLVLDGNNISTLPIYSQSNLLGVSLRGNPVNSFCWAMNMKVIQTIRVDEDIVKNRSELKCAKAIENKLDPKPKIVPTTDTAELR